MTVRSQAQIIASIRLHLREAFRRQYTDDAAVQYAIDMMGAEHAPLIGRVLVRDFKTTDPI